MIKFQRQFAIGLIATFAVSLLVAPAAKATQETTLTSVSGFTGSISKLRPIQETAVLQALLENPAATAISCTGLTPKNAKSAEKKLALARAKATCSYAKKVLPELKTKTSSAITTSKKLSGQVEIALQGVAVSHEPTETELSFPTMRNLTDQPDAVKGFQVKPIYLVPSDGVDQHLDLNGQITKFLDEGNDFMERSIAKRFAVDRLADGSYDIGFVNSDYSIEEIHSIYDSDELFLGDLLKGTPFEAPGSNRKIYAIFFAGAGSDEFCGLGDNPGQFSIIATLGDCSGPANGFTFFESEVWIHEVIHNLGVDHVEEACDLMGAYEEFGGTTPCYRDELVTLDSQNRYYVNSDAAGADILESGLWEGQNLRSKNSKGQCTELLGSEWSEMLCPVGKVQVGPREWCWDDVQSAQLQVLKKGKWVKVANGKGTRTPWGDKDVWSCERGDESPTATVTLSPGTNWYRWLVNGSTELPFRVTVQN